MKNSIIPALEKDNNDSVYLLGDEEFWEYCDDEVVLVRTQNDIWNAIQNYYVWCYNAALLPSKVVANDIVKKTKKNKKLKKNMTPIPDKKKIKHIQHWCDLEQRKIKQFCSWYININKEAQDNCNFPLWETNEYFMREYMMFVESQKEK